MNVWSQIPQGSVTSNIVTLTVNPDVNPSITTQPTGLTVTAPATATFTVVATGGPVPTYQWQQEVSGASNYTAISGATNASYTTPATTTTNSGTNYECVVSNLAGTVTSSAATLSVNPAIAPPTIPVQPVNAAAKAINRATHTIFILLLAAVVAAVVYEELVAPLIDVKLVAPGASCCHWYVGAGFPVANIVNVAVDGAFTAALTGWTGIVGGRSRIN